MDNLLEEYFEDSDTSKPEINRYFILRASSEHII